MEPEERERRGERREERTGEQGKRERKRRVRRREKGKGRGREERGERKRKEEKRDGWKAWKRQSGRASHFFLSSLRSPLSLGLVLFSLRTNAMNRKQCLDPTHEGYKPSLKRR